MWTGDYLYLVRQLVSKDFKIRYRRMSLGIFWSLLNPLVMMAVYTYVFSVIFKSAIPHFPVHLLSAIISFNFFSSAWLGATTSILDNAGLIKRNPVNREIIPIASIFSNVPHLLIQICLLVAFVYIGGLSINAQWLWLPFLWALLILCLVGIGLASSAIYVLMRDMRYIVESANIVLFWVVPVIYTFEMVPGRLQPFYQFNPIAALVICTQTIIIKSEAPPLALVAKLAFVSAVCLIAGLSVFKHIQRKFYEYL